MNAKENGYKNSVNMLSREGHMLFGNMGKSATEGLKGKNVVYQGDIDDIDNTLEREEKRKYGCIWLYGLAVLRIFAS